MLAHGDQLDTAPAGTHLAAMLDMRKHGCAYDFCREPGKGKPWSHDKSGTYYARSSSSAARTSAVDPRFIVGSTPADAVWGIV